MAADPNKQTPDNSGTPTDKPTEDEDAHDDLLMQVNLAKPNEFVFDPCQFRLVVLRETNYFVWSCSHRHFLQSRGIWGIVSGSLPRPTTSENEARNWMLLDGWIATHLFGHMKQSQQSHINHLRRSKDIWDRLRGVHYGKGHLVSLLMQFYGYTKPVDESIDVMASKLECLSYEIHDISPESKPSGEVRAIIMMKACQGDEYNVAKFFLRHADTLTPELAVKHLWFAEQGLQKPKKAVNTAKGNRGKPGGQQKPYVR